MSSNCFKNFATVPGPYRRTIDKELKKFILYKAGSSIRTMFIRLRRLGGANWTATEDEILRGVSHWTLDAERDFQLALRKNDQEIRLRYRFLHDRTKGVHDWSPDELQKLSSLLRM